MDEGYPFSVFKPKGRIYYQVDFKDKSGKITRKSTETEVYSEALALAKLWASSNFDTEKPTVEKAITNYNFTDSELLQLVQKAKEKGVIAGVTVKGHPSDVPAVDYLTDFWTWGKSEYIQEKIRQGQRIHKSHCANCLNSVRRYWAPFLKEKKLCELTRKDIKAFVFSLDDLQLAFSTKNQILMAGTVAFNYAFNEEIIEKDITHGIIKFSGKPQARNILTPELAQALFSIQWGNETAKIANLLAMCTGMRLGEIMALRLCDLGENTIYVKHSWNRDEGLKTPKNGEERKIYLPFPQLIERLKEMGESNPYNKGLEAFIFYGLTPDKPIDHKIFTKFFWRALQDIGLSEDEARKYCFHGWRHYYASYMKDRVSDRLLQSQTGHKSLAMLEHYADHRLESERLEIERANREAFGSVLECWL